MSLPTSFRLLLYNYIIEWMPTSADGYFENQFSWEFINLQSKKET